MATIILDAESFAINPTSSVVGRLVLSGYFGDERSADRGVPEELYEFNRDDTDYWRYTSSDTNISYSGDTYTAVLIRRNDIHLTANSLKNKIEITVALSNLFARNYIGGTPEGRIQLTIYRRHGTSYVIYWKGFINGVSFKSKKITIIAGLKDNSLKRYGLMRKFQRNCGLALYSDWCGISESDVDFRLSGTILTVSGTIITATVFGTEANDWLLGGKLKTTSGSCNQKIVYHQGTTIKIARPVLALTVGDAITANAGCDHLKGTCKTKFSNKLNFGGQPYLPDKNPFDGNVVA